MDISFHQKGVLFWTSVLDEVFQLSACVCACARVCFDMIMVSSGALGLATCLQGKLGREMKEIRTSIDKLSSPWYPDISHRPSNARH